MIILCSNQIITYLLLRKMTTVVNKDLYINNLDNS